jgi:hypothetical protein
MHLESRFRIALVLYAVLGLLIWFTLGDATVHVGGRDVQIRWLPVLIVGAVVGKPLLYRQAERIRSEDGERK